MTQTREEIEAFVISTEEALATKEPSGTDLPLLFALFTICQLLDQTAPPEVKEGELLPCPFCGGAEAYAGKRLGGWVAFCPDCDAVEQYGLTKEEAVKAWNTRALPPPPEGE